MLQVNLTDLYVLWHKHSTQKCMLSSSCHQVSFPLTSKSLRIVHFAYIFNGSRLLASYFLPLVSISPACFVSGPGEDAYKQVLPCSPFASVRLHKVVLPANVCTILLEDRIIVLQSRSKNDIFDMIIIIGGAAFVNLSFLGFECPRSMRGFCSPITRMMTPAFFDVRVSNIRHCDRTNRWEWLLGGEQHRIALVKGEQ